MIPLLALLRFSGETCPRNPRFQGNGSTLQLLLADLTERGNLFAEGVFVLEQGWLYASILLCGFMVALIGANFQRPLVG